MSGFIVGSALLGGALGLGGVGVLAGAAIGGLGGALISSQYKQGQDALKAQKQSSAAAISSAIARAKAADEAANRANQKRPDPSALLDAATQTSRGGVAGTLLTGASGVDASKLTLGRNSLLGG